MNKTTTKASFECVIAFDGNGEMNVNSNHILDESTAHLIAEIIKPFLKISGKDKLLEQCYPLRIKAEYIDGELDNYSVGFTNSTNIKQVTEQLTFTS